MCWGRRGRGRASSCSPISTPSGQDPPGGWDTDPYRAARIGGRIYGVGTADDKAGAASVLTAARALLPRLEGVRLAVGLVHGKLGGGGDWGTLPVMERAGEVEASVYCHPAETGLGMAHFKTASRGFFNFRIETLGRRPEPVEIRPPNSEDPRRGINAFTRLREVLDAVDGWAGQNDLLCSVNWASAGVSPVVLPERAAAEGAVWFGRGTAAEVYRSLDRAASRAGTFSTRLFGVRADPPRRLPVIPWRRPMPRRGRSRDRRRPRPLPRPCRIGHSFSDSLFERRRGRVRRPRRKFLRPRRMGGRGGHAPGHPGDHQDRLGLGRPDRRRPAVAPGLRRRLGAQKPPPRAAAGPGRG